MKDFTKNWLDTISIKFAGVFSNIKDYFNSYGGLYELIRSPYLISSLLFNVLLYKSWTTSLWISDIKGIIPSILGFSLGSYAILATFGNERFQNLITNEDNGENTLYRKINTTFIHFIIIQAFSLLLAILCTSLLSEPYGLLEIIISFIGNLTFIYSIFLAVASVLTIFRITKIYQKYINVNNSDRK